MAAFDLEEAARQGRSGAIPPKWNRFSVSRGTLWFNLTVYGIAALILIGAAVYVFITGVFSSNSSPISAPFEAGALLILGFIFLAVSLRVLPALINSAGHFFLITPNGFVLVSGRRLVGLPLSEIRAASREQGMLGAKLVVQPHAGRPLILPIGRIYGTRALREMEEALMAGLKPADQDKRKKRK